MLEPHVVVKAGVSDGERDREEALGRGRDPGSLAERRSGGAAARPHSLPQVLALPRGIWRTQPDCGYLEVHSEWMN